jgi:phospholipid/cholesterol/gamma-HCH transport system substrate-binding protein
VSRFVRDGGEVFGALSERQGQLRGLIESANTVFETTARRNEDLATAFRVFPTFLRESRATLARLEQFSIDTDPVVTALKPTARELTPTVRSLGGLAVELERFFPALQRTIAGAPAGFRATRRLLDERLPPLLEGFDPWLSQVNPIFEVIRRYRREVTSALANLAAASNGAFFDIGAGTTLRYVRTLAPLSPDALAAYPRRLSFTRSNPYVRPGGYLDVRTAMQSFETRHCAGGVSAALDPAAPTDPDFLARVQDDPADAQLFFDRLRAFSFQNQLDTDAMAAPPCSEQAPLESIGEPAEVSDYLHVRPLP